MHTAQNISLDKQTKNARQNKINERASERQTDR